MPPTANNHVYIAIPLKHPEDQYVFNFDVPQAGAITIEICAPPSQFQPTTNTKTGEPTNKNMIKTIENDPSTTPVAKKRARYDGMPPFPFESFPSSIFELGQEHIGTPLRNVTEDLKENLPPPVMADLDAAASAAAQRASTSKEKKPYRRYEKPELGTLPSRYQSKESK
ncbi:hypothetical protein V8E55_009453 [Tylopilus felleus]